MRVRFLSFVVLSASLAGCGGGDGVELPDSPTPTADAEPLAVETRAVEAREVQPTIDVVGTAEPIRAADLGPQMSGRIIAIEVDEGAQVEAGQVIARLDARSERLGASSAASNAAGASARVRQLEQELARLRPLAQRGTVPSQQIEQMELQLEAARAAADAAHSGAAQARTVAGNSTVVAPFAGVVASIPMEEGETATMMPPSTVVRLVDLSAVDIEAQVAERELARLSEGAPATVRFVALDRAYEGSVVRIAPEIDPRSRTVQVVVRVDNEDRRLRGGMSAEVSIQPGGARTALAVPADAVRGMGESRRVYVATDGRAVERRIRVAPLSSDALEVVEGLEPGETVVSPLPARLRDGAAIITGAASATAEAPAGDAT